MAKTVLITGTSSGIGRLGAELFATRGWDVAACSRNPQADLSQTPTTEKLLSLRMDVTDKQSVSDAVAAAQDHFGAIDVYGILVKLIEPSHFETNFIARSLQCTKHPAYDTAFRDYRDWMKHEDEKAPEPALVAEAVYKAASDKSERLRYPVKVLLILALISLLPDKFGGHCLDKA